MATVTSLTAARILQLLDGSINGATVNNLGNLILTTRGGESIDAGSVTLPGGTIQQYYRGDKTWATLDKSAVGLNLVDNVSVKSDYVPKWQPSAVYLAGQQVITPTNLVVTANIGHTSSAAFATDVAKWDVAATGRGLVAYAELKTNSGAIGFVTVVTNIPTFTFKANRRYRIEVSGTYYASGTASTAVFSIYSASTADAAGAVSGLTALKQTSDRPNVSTEGRGINLVRSGLTFATDTTLQIKYTIERISGGDGFFSQASATSPLTLAIYDDGSQV